MKRACVLALVAACGSEPEIEVDAAVDGAPELDADTIDAAIDARVIDAPMPSWAVTWTCTDGCAGAAPRPFITHNIRLAPIGTGCAAGDSVRVYWFGGPDEYDLTTCHTRSSLTCFNAGYLGFGDGINGSVEICAPGDGSRTGTATGRRETGDQTPTTWTFTAVAE